MISYRNVLWLELDTIISNRAEELMTDDGYDMKVCGEIVEQILDTIGLIGFGLYLNLVKEKMEKLMKEAKE